ncbi:MAG: peptidylprolyl isomerase [Deltaproteobacteria bacterium]|nr:peptidylprolyl isomerase [Deltaproteobacteria bacterium]
MIPSRRRAVLHFLLAGAALFALTHRTAPSPAAPSAARTDDDLLADAALARGLDRDDAVIQRRLVRNMAFLDGDGCDSPALYDEARGLGLDHTDVVVRRRLAQRMRFALESEARAAEPSDTALEEYLAGHPDRFQLPARVSLTQVFLRRERAAALAADAAALRARLAAGAAPAGLGDPLPLPARLTQASAAQVGAWLGDQVAAAAFALPLDTWSAPVASPYGVHLLRVEARRPAELPPLAAVRAAVREAWLEERGRLAVETALRRWRGGQG